MNDIKIILLLIISTLLLFLMIFLCDNNKNVDEIKFKKMYEERYDK